MYTQMMISLGVMVIFFFFFLNSLVGTSLLTNFNNRSYESQTDRSGLVEIFIIALISVRLTFVIRQTRVSRYDDFF